jgi:hypothetical protein
VFKTAQAALFGGHSLTEATWTDSSGCQKLSAVVVFLKYLTEEATDDKYSISLPKRNKSKKLRAMEFDPVN